MGHRDPSRWRRAAITLWLGALSLTAIVVATVDELLPARAIGQIAGSRTIDVTEIRPGMRGYGLSVFRGTTPERFDIEVIDVLHQFRPDQDLILVRTSHPILEEAPTVGGMSGSPIYIEGRLAGAYAYGWPYGRHPVVGVTPIRSMLAEIDRPVRPDSFPGAVPLAPTGTEREPGRRRPAPRVSVVDPYLGDRPADPFAALLAHQRRAAPREGGAAMIPVSTPLLVGGLDPEAVQLMAQHFAPFGIDVLQAGGAGTPSTTPMSFSDGGALAVTVARGDISSNVIGTVTHIAGQRLVAFGHPMLEAGETGLPTAVARVLHVLASLQRSFKIAEPVAPVGALIHDRQAAIVVDQQLQPAMIPVRLRIAGVPDAHRTEWSFEVASHRLVTPLLLITSVASAVKSVASDQTHAMFEAQSRVWLDGRSEPIALSDRGYSSTGPSPTTALARIRAFDVVESAFANPFEESRPTRVEIDLSLRFARETEEIVDAQVAATEVDPGERIQLRVISRRFGQPEQVRLVPIEIPESAAGHEIQVLVQPGPDVEIERPEPRSLEDVLRAVRERYGASSMVVSVRMPSRGLRMAGHVVRGLPPSALDALQSTADGDRARPTLTYRRFEVPTDHVLSGGARVELRVRRLARSDD